MFSPIDSAYQLNRDRQALQLCTWSGILSIMLAIIGMVMLSEFIPATKPLASGQVIADFYISNLNGIRLGMLISMIAFSLFVPFGVVIAILTRPLERLPVLTYVQITSIAIATMEGVLCCTIWLVAAYRPAEISPDITRMLHDFGWIVFLVTIPPFVIWIAAIGFAILNGKGGNGVFPRWLGFFNLWVAVLITPAMVLPFFKTGPFAYNGLLALYLPFGVFFLWMLVMTPALLSAIKQHIVNEEKIEK